MQRYLTTSALYMLTLQITIYRRPCSDNPDSSADKFQGGWRLALALMDKQHDTMCAVLAASLPSTVITEPGSLPDKLNEFFRKVASDKVWVCKHIMMIVCIWNIAFVLTHYTDETPAAPYRVRVWGSRQAGDYKYSVSGHCLYGDMRYHHYPIDCY